MADFLLAIWVVWCVCIGTLTAVLVMLLPVLVIAEKLWFATCVTVMECRYSVEPLSLWRRLRVWLWHVNNTVHSDRRFGKCDSIQVGRWTCRRPFGLPRENANNVRQ